MGELSFGGTNAGTVAEEVKKVDEVEVEEKDEVAEEAADDEAESE